MLQFAVVDDDHAVCLQMEKYISACFNERSILHEMTSYLSGEALLIDISQGQCFDLIFLDVELDKINGIETGNLLRKKSAGAITQIVYISGKSEYAMQLFQNHPFDFLLNVYKAEAAL